MDIFEEINKEIQATEKRWKAIDSLAAPLKQKLDDGTLEITDFRDALGLVLLLTEQLRPALNVGSGAKQMQEEITNMLGTLLKKE